MTNFYILLYYFYFISTIVITAWAMVNDNISSKNFTTKVVLIVVILSSFSGLVKLPVAFETNNLKTFAVNNFSLSLLFWIYFLNNIHFGQRLRCTLQSLLKRIYYAKK